MMPGASVVNFEMFLTLCYSWYSEFEQIMSVGLEKW